MPNRPPTHNSKNQPELPNNVDDCHKLIKELFARVAELEKQLSRRNRAMFGKKSAKVDSSLLTGTGKAVHTSTSNELAAEQQRLNVVTEIKKGGGRSSLPSGLTTRDEKHLLPEKDIPCPCCGTKRKIIGFDVSYQLEFARMVFENIQHTVFKYAIETPKEKVAPFLPAQVTPNSLYDTFSKPQPIDLTNMDEKGRPRVLDVFDLKPEPVIDRNRDAFEE